MKRCYLPLIALVLICLALAMSAHADSGAITGCAWRDTNGDGVYEKEKGFPGILVTLEQRLENGNIKPIQTVETDEYGLYLFDGVPAGVYRVSFTVPDGYHFAMHGIDSDVLPSATLDSCTPFFHLSEGERVDKLAGISRFSTYITLFTFLDNNANGGRMTSEPPVPDVHFVVQYEYDGQTYDIAAATSRADGQCVVRNLTPGTYTIRAELPENLTAGPLGEKLNSFHNCFLPGQGNTAVSVPFTIPYKGNIGLAIGLVRTGSLKGTFRFDANADGQWQEGETVVPGTRVTLQSQNLAEPVEASISANGEYLFTSLQPGEFELVFSMPEGYLFSESDESLLHGATNSGTLHVTVQESTTTDVGSVLYTQGSAVTLRVIEDGNQNSAADAGEKPVAGAIVQLAQNGAVIGQSVTDGSGEVSFPTARYGDASFTVTLPDGYFFADTVENERTENVRVSEQQTSFELYAVRLSAISGMLFDDPTNTGIYSDRSTPLSGFTVMAINDNGEIAASSVTDASGSYRLSGLLAGDYRVRFLLDENYIAAPFGENAIGISNRITSQTPEYGETDKFSLPYDTLMEHVDGAVFRAGIVDGYVLSNANHDNLVTNEGGVQGVRATLIGENGLPVSDYSYGVSDENGYFTIKGVMPGRYAVSYTLPENCAFNTPLTDNPDVRTEYFEIEGGSELRLQPVGVVNTALIAGKCVRFSDQQPVEGVRIKLVSDSFEDAWVVTTDAEGAYSFSGLRPDTYVLTITLPDGFIFAQCADSIMPGKVSNTISARIALKRGQTFKDANIVVDPPAALSGMVYLDRDMDLELDSDEVPVVGRDIELMLDGKPVKTLTTDESGAFYADSLVPAVYQINVPLQSNEFILDDSLEKNDWKVTVTADTYPVILPFVAYGSINGQVWNLDGSKCDVQGIPVTLYDEEHKAAGFATTDDNGDYSFDKLLPGTYTLDAKLPGNYLFARKQDTSAGSSSYITSGVNGDLSYEPILLDSGEQLTGIDLGIGSMGVIGDYAWLDENKNGMQDIGESPLPGIQIDMYQYGEFVTSVVTDSAGHYLLENLYPGEYEMRVTMPAEIKPTVQQFNYPLVGSILPASESTTVSINLIVPSGGENLHMDLGFMLKSNGVYPQCLKKVFVKDWTPYAER